MEVVKLDPNDFFCLISWIENVWNDLNEIKFTKTNIIKLQKNYWFLIQIIQDWGFHNPILGVKPQEKNKSINFS